MRFHLTALALTGALALSIAGLASANNDLANASSMDVYDALRNDEVEADDRKAALNTMRQAAKQEPNNADWRVGLALAYVELEEWKKARTEADKAVELAPNVSDHHVVLAEVIFAGINDAPLLSKGGLASKGKKAYERAAELDPDNADARAGLAGFYIFAPSIAGGSLTKGREHAEALTEIEGAERTGYIFMAQIAMKQKKWDEVDSAVASALEVSMTPGERVDVVRSIALALVFQSKAYDRAEAIVVAHSDDIASDSTALYCLGVALHEQKKHKDAIDAFQRVLAVKSDAVNTRFRLGQCYEKLKMWREAQRYYQEYIDMFPDGSDRKAAKKGVKRMKKKLR